MAETEHRNIADAKGSMVVKPVERPLRPPTNLILLRFRRAQHTTPGIRLLYIMFFDPST